MFLKYFLYFRTCILFVTRRLKGPCIIFRYNKKKLFCLICKSRYSCRLQWALFYTAIKCAPRLTSGNIYLDLFKYGVVWSHVILLTSKHSKFDVSKIIIFIFSNNTAGFFCQIFVEIMFC